MIQAIGNCFLKKGVGVNKDYKEDIVTRLIKRAVIRRQIKDRKSVQEGKPDRIADILEEAAEEILSLRDKLIEAVLTDPEKFPIKERDTHE